MPHEHHICIFKFNTVNESTCLNTMIAYPHSNPSFFYLGTIQSLY